jgi:pimeloyl-ACP methyl ester carboxylesterase
MLSEFEIRDTRPGFTNGAGDVTLGSGPLLILLHRAAYGLAHLYPDAVSKLVLIDCLLPGTENMDVLRGGAGHCGFHMAPDVPEMSTEGRKRDYIRAQTRAWSRRKDAISEGAIADYAQHYAIPGGMTVGFNFYRALREDAPLVAVLQRCKLSMPVMTHAGLYGVGDRPATALRTEAEDLARVVAENSGHFVAEEEPELLCERLESFFQFDRR